MAIVDQPELATAPPAYADEKVYTEEKPHVLASDVSGTQSNPSDYDGELPDPDVGKSDEERARLVRPSLSHLEKLCADLA